MQILVTGATGFVGSVLVPMLREAGHGVSIVSRGAAGDHDWSRESLAAGVAAADAVVHLAGENIFGRRWTEKQKEILRASRVDTTATLAGLCAELGTACLLSTSAVGFYGPSDADALNENAPAGSDFLARLCADWEQATEVASDAGVRVARVRVGVVLGPGGGALSKMLTPFRWGVGGRIGSGRQGFPWIHLTDLCRTYVHLLTDSGAEGAFNATAPHPVTNSELTRELGRVLRRPTLFPVPGLALRVILGEASSVLLTGQRAVPDRLLERGFSFEHPELGPALDDLLGGRGGRSG